MISLVMLHLTPLQKNLYTYRDKLIHNMHVANGDYFNASIWSVGKASM